VRHYRWAIMRTSSEKTIMIRYSLLLGLEAAGAIVILWHGVPIYRSLLADTFIQHADGTSITWAIVGILLIQVPYWISTLKVFRWLSVPRHIVASHVVTFLARLNFVFVSGLFAAVVFARGADLAFVPWRAAILAAVLFSMFCFSLELERLAKRLADE
jgi:hypothetical protein